MIRVGVVGYGTIGKRVADAIQLQDDMELSGVTAHSYHYRMRLAQEQGVKIFHLGNPESFAESNLELEGDIHNLLEDSDIVVDCSPKPFGAQNKALYQQHNVKAIFQGGEKADIADASFVAQCNFEDAVGKNYVRVVSCNTTGLSRTIHALQKAYGVKRARATLIRRAADPAADKGGPVNSIIPSLELPSHHGPDVRTVIPEVEVFTTALIVPTTLMHVHNLSVHLKGSPSTEEVVDLFRRTPRVRVLAGSDNIKSTSNIVEMARDMGFKRGDMHDICIWEKGVGIHGEELFYPQAVHQEADVVPENIDAIRAMMGISDMKTSMRKTDESLKPQHLKQATLMH